MSLTFEVGAGTRQDSLRPWLLRSIVPARAPPEDRGLPQGQLLVDNRDKCQLLANAIFRVNPGDLLWPSPFLITPARRGDHAGVIRFSGEPRSFGRCSASQIRLTSILPGTFDFLGLSDARMRYSTRADFVPVSRACL